MADVLQLLAEAQTKWQAADADGWLALFAPDAKFFIPGATPISGDHDMAAVRSVLPRLMRAGGEDSGQWVIDSYVSDGGAVSLVDQKVLRDGTTHHYHGMFLYEFGPTSGDRFAFWWLMVHEYEAFAAAWG